MALSRRERAPQPEALAVVGPLITDVARPVGLGDLVLQILVHGEEVLDLAKRSETAIYAIGLRQTDIGRPRFKEAEFVLRQLSQETGGRAFFPTSIDELPKIYQKISDELSTQYSIAYTSKNPLSELPWLIRVSESSLGTKAVDVPVFQYHATTDGLGVVASYT